MDKENTDKDVHDKTKLENQNKNDIFPKELNDEFYEGYSKITENRDSEFNEFMHEKNTDVKFQQEYDDDIKDETKDPNMTSMGLNIFENKLSRINNDLKQFHKLSSYIKVNTKEEIEFSLFTDKSGKTFILDFPEDIHDQELLNELFKTNMSSDIKTEINYEHGFSRTSLLNKKSTSSSDSLINRTETISKIKTALSQRKSLIENNRLYQLKLVEHFKLLKAKQKPRNKSVSEKDFVIDFNTQYERYWEVLQVVIDELASETSKYQEKIENLKTFSEIKTKQNDDLNKTFHKYQENIGSSSLHSRTGFKLDNEVMKEFFNTESKKEAIIKFERLCNLKLQHKNVRFDRALRSKENFEGGLRLIDFEQLKIENQTFNEKVEERREAINKLNGKITNCTHLLSHIKEKISFTDNDKRSSNQKLIKLIKDFKKVQKLSNRTKKVRDSIKSNNKTLQMSCGLLGNKDYLRKYEECYDNVNNLTNSILKTQLDVQNISLETEDVINKINHAKKNK